MFIFKILKCPLSIPFLNNCEHITIFKEELCAALEQLPQADVFGDSPRVMC